MRLFSGFPYFILSLLPLFINLTGCKLDAGTGEKTVFLLSGDKGILISKNFGKKWKPFNEGLPLEITPLKIKSDSRKNLYLLTLDSGVYKLNSGDDKWHSINSPKFLSPLNNSKKEYRKISAFAVNDENPDQLVLATKYSAFISNNGGSDWDNLPTNGIEKIYYISALAITGAKPVIYVGTSYKGLYRGTAGKFEKFSSGLPIEKYSTTTYFHEEITEIYSNRIGSGVYAGFAFGKGIYSLNGNTWKTVKMEAPGSAENIDFIHQITAGRSNLFVSTDSGIFAMDIPTREWRKHETEELLNNLPGNGESLSMFILDETGENPGLFYHLRDYKKKHADKNNSRHANRKALYSSAYSAKGKINSLVKLIKETGLNSIVIDMKDDFGYLYFPTNSNTAKEIGSGRYPINISGILKTLKDNGIYSIARIVVFKDRFLFNAYNHKYAVWNWKTNTPWQGNSKEHWVDPNSSFVRNYNIEIAGELEALGFDEIQFDYIRFPTDGQTHLCNYRFKEHNDVFKSEVLSLFLKTAKSVIKIPISVDIYGFNAWYKCGNWMGQDIEEFSTIVDVICPMDYPSHFGNQFLMEGPRNLHPYRIIYHAGKRANRHVNGRSVIRPYLQAFNLLSPTWSPEYISNQIKGAEESNCSGYTFWNAKTDYEMVRRALLK